MKRLTYLAMLLLLSSFSILAQGGLTLSGVITSDQGYPLPGADILVKGTNQGTVTNFDGEYTFQTTQDSGVLVISYVGYIDQEIEFSGNKTSISVDLKTSSLGLKEIMIISSRAIDRKTPVASSTINKEEIQSRLGNQEFVEILKSTPGVSVNQQGGGFGDGEVNMRGFNSENVAVLINGIPVNDMEDGRVFWSNWAGLGNVTSSVQTQRGLGASKLAVPSIGGTINTITENTDAEQGGSLIFSAGNNEYKKYGAKFSTGLSEKGFAGTISATRETGNGYVDGTPFESVSYYGSISKKFNEKHKLILTGIGTTQQHGTRFTQQTIQDIRNPNNDRGIRYNEDWGIRNGEVYSMSRNYFNKPLISLNHYWNINESNLLSTAVYYSSGTGGVEFDLTNDDALDQSLSENRFGSDYGAVDVDKIVEQNIELAANGEETGTVMQAFRNNHTWWGALSTLNSDLTESLNLTGGVDLRYYRGQHYREVTDLLGGAFYLDDSDVNNSEDRKIAGDRFGFDNDGIVFWSGGFAQLEYDNEFLSAFVSGNLSNTSYQRVDYFAIPDSEDQSTDFINFLGFGAKGGANYRLDDYNNIFVNGGYFERAPFFDAVFPTDSNFDINEDALNQKIISVEIGYGLRLEKLAMNLNLYWTKWNDRTEVITIDLIDEETGETLDERAFANIQGVDALHKGIEFDMEYKPFDNLTITGMFSLGDWNWVTPLAATNIFDPDGNFVETRLVNLDDVPVGRSAQTTSALGVSYDIVPSTTLRMDYTYAGRFFANFDVDGRSVELDDVDLDTSDEELNEIIANTNTSFVDPWQMPDYFLFDLSLSHKFKFGKNMEGTLNAQMFNVFNEEYITFANDNGGTASGAQVHFGKGRSFSVGTTINF